MGNDQPSPILSSNMNMAITIFGFALSAIFMLVICGRLLCSRVRHGASFEMRQPARRNVRSLSIERSLHGMEPSVVASFPTIKYSQQIFASSEDHLCTICLGDYKEKEVLRVLPRCGHAFHVSCIDVWLRQHYTCPVCRLSLRVTSSLISFSARSRFIPGAIPDCLFDQPTQSPSLCHEDSRHSPHEHASISCPQKSNLEENGGVEMGEPSVLALREQNCTIELLSTRQTEDCQQLLGLNTIPYFSSNGESTTLDDSSGQTEVRDSHF